MQGAAYLTQCLPQANSYSAFLPRTQKRVFGAPQPRLCPPSDYPPRHPDKTHYDIWSFQGYRPKNGQKQKAAVLTITCMDGEDSTVCFQRNRSIKLNKSRAVVCVQ